ncbi:SDR family NAD(P)-dependent oxidoreductase, partial [Streptomyces sp. NPDC001920]
HTLHTDHPETTTLTTALTTLHTQGHPPTWNTVLPHTTTRPDLPTYAFQHRRYWLEDAERARPSAARSALSGPDRWTYRVVWRPLAASRPGPDPLLAGTWLLMVPAEDMTGSGDAWAAWAERALTEHGARVERVAVDTANADRQLLADHLRVGADGPDELGGVLSLLPLDDAPHPAHPAVPRGVAATLALAQAMADRSGSGRLWTVTRGAVRTGHGDPAARPGQAQVWGLGRSVALEQPERWGGLLDLPEEVDGESVVALVRVLSGAIGEDQVALRSGGALACRLVRTPSKAAGALGHRAWRPRGTVLITGGTGGIGAHVARWCAGAGAEHLVLAGRRGGEAPGVAELESELNALGVKVTVVACDMASREDVGRLLSAVPASSPLSAVVHAAGVAQRFAKVDELTLDGFADVVAGKVAGALHLDDALGDTPLDAFIVFSSNAAVWGSGSNGAYAAGNAFLDVFAAERRARGRTATSIAWGAWGGGGMLALDGVAEYMDRRGVLAMAPADAIAVMVRAVEDDETFLAVADIDWERFVPGFTSGRPSPLLSELPEVRRALGEADTASRGAARAAGAADAGAVRAGLTERLAPLTEQEQLDLLLGVVRDSAKDVLHHQEDAGIAIGPDRAFKDLGFDSLTSVELRNRLYANTGLKLSAGVVFDHPTPLALATHLRTELAPPPAMAEFPQVQRELDALERAVPGLLEDGATAAEDRRRLAERLERLAWRLRADGETHQLAGGPAADVRAGADAGALDSASAEEIFDLIDRELGQAPHGDGGSAPTGDGTHGNG